MRFSQILLITAALAATGVAAAQPSWHEHGGDELTRGVVLTQAQQDQIHTIEQQAWSQAKPVARQMQSLHEQITDRLLGAGQVSQTDLAPLMQQVSALRAQLNETRMEAALQIRAVMTPSQLAEAATKHAQIESLRDQEHRVMHGSGE